jgi:Ulp1 family protease
MQVHWICAVASMQEHIIRIYDSGDGDSWSQYLEAILKFIGDEHQAVKGTKLPEPSKWLLLSFDTSTPRQQNSKRVVVWFLKMYSCFSTTNISPFFSYYC